jgi:hypothetical protein
VQPRLELLEAVDEKLLETSANATAVATEALSLRAKDDVTSDLISSCDFGKQRSVSRGVEFGSNSCCCCCCCCCC